LPVKPGGGLPLNPGGGLPVKPCGGLPEKPFGGAFFHFQKFAVVLLLVVLMALSLTFTEAADAQKPTGPPPKGFSGRPPHGFTGSAPPGFSGSPPPGFTGKPKGNQLRFQSCHVASSSRCMLLRLCRLPVEVNLWQR
ncbi:hypothetical protein OESDEN_15719, partial [Oesophagostomum dentatum]